MIESNFVCEDFHNLYSLCRFSILGMGMRMRMGIEMKNLYGEGGYGDGDGDAAVG